MLAEYFVKARLSDEDESLESFATRRLGREAFENLVEPIVRESLLLIQVA